MINYITNIYDSDCFLNSEKRIFIKELGRGVRARVILEQDANGKQWAFKKFHRDMPSIYPPEANAYWESLFDSNGVSKRALFELEISKKLKHPAFVKIEEMTQEGGLSVLKMEYIENTPIGSMNQLEMLEAIKDLVSAFKEAYDQGYLHTDFGLGSNMLIDKKSHRLRLIDLESFQTIQSYLEEDPENNLSSFFNRILESICDFKLHGFSAENMNNIKNELERVIDDTNVFKKWEEILKSYKFKAHPSYFYICKCILI